MSDSHDSGAADRIRVYLGACANNGFSFAGSERAVTDSFSGKRVVFTLEDLRAVVAENAAMRQRLAALKVVWESIYSSDEYDTKAEALAAATKDRFETAAVDEDVMWRLVGPWTAAGQQAAESAEPSPRHDSARCAPAGGGCVCGEP